MASTDQDSDIVLPCSILDTDLYKFTMQQAVLKHFSHVQASYRFTNRDKARSFSRACFDRLKASVAHFSDLVLAPAERAWLARACSYFTPTYLDFLSSYRFDPAQVHIAFIPRADSADEGDIEIDVTGPWVETILWEVPLMATLSEIFFLTDDMDWDMAGQDDLAFAKAERLLAHGCIVSEFGTRRRRSYAVQDVVVSQMKRAHSAQSAGRGKLAGTSNAYLAYRHDLTPIGTIAHEWFMGVAALTGYEGANGRAMDLWEAVYPDVLLIALTDTFSTKAFFDDFAKDVERARRWRGLRQDSGDPHAFAPAAKAVYDALGIDSREKTIIYSDALDVDKALELQAQCSALGFNASFGIGTFLTNDFCKVSDSAQKSKALNIVIKVAEVDGRPCVKISDDLLKNTGDAETVDKVKDMYGLPKA
ncbi:nicotinate phosphoribosyltransferase [Vararia minispora EC-137]|uniref:Nicotinate phosphoribosyltransferase n=1 Tax=Vararia minispora EC-137 TaxID=1314806 RepID=A0ACB8Q6H4_9AGAM|nr:nicotinate phosphoribosyltransferase [Vararia minispora EC-137]